jgi:hypothetical protein
LYLLEDVIGEMRDVTGKSRAEDMTAKDMTGEKGMTITGANDTRSEDNKDCASLGIWSSHKVKVFTGHIGTHY